MAVSFALGVLSLSTAELTQAAQGASTRCFGKAPTLTVTGKSGRGTKGNDVIVVSSRSGARVRGGPGDDRICGGVGPDVLKAGAGKNWISGGDGEDSLVGGSGRNVLLGRAMLDSFAKVTPRTRTDAELGETVNGVAKTVSYKLRKDAVQIAAAAIAGVSGPADGTQTTRIRLHRQERAPRVGQGFVVEASPAAPYGVLGEVVRVKTRGRLATVVTTPTTLDRVYSRFQLRSQSTLSDLLSDDQARRMRRATTAGVSCRDEEGKPVSVNFNPDIDLSRIKISTAGEINLTSGYVSLDVDGALDDTRPILAATVEASAEAACEATVEAPPIPVGGPITADVAAYIKGSVSGAVSATARWEPRFYVGALVGNSQSTLKAPFDAGSFTQDFDGEGALTLKGGLRASLSVAGRAGMRADVGPELSLGIEPSPRCLVGSVGLPLTVEAYANAFVAEWSATLIEEDIIGSTELFRDCKSQPETPTPDPVLGTGVEEISHSREGDDEQVGRVTGFAPGETAWLLSSGVVADAAINDPSYLASSEIGGPASSELSALVGNSETFDSASYTAVLKPSGDVLHIRYVFASEEYPEFVGEGYDDVMAIYVNGDNCALVPGTSDRVSVDTVNSSTNPAYFVDNASGASGYATSMDGLTKPLQCDIPVTPNQPVTVKVALADTGDGVYDSAVALLDQGIWSD